MRMSIRLVLVLAAICSLALIILAGCEHDVEQQSGNGSAVTFATVNTDVLEPHCGSCHMGGSANGGLSISGFNSIVNTPSRQKSALDLIEPNDTTKSYLYLKITGDPSISGDRMPPGDTLPQDKIDLIASWIDAGAPETAAATKSILSADNSQLTRR